MKKIYLSLFMLYSVFVAYAAPQPSMALLLEGIYPLSSGGSYTHPIAFAQGTVHTFNFTVQNTGSADLALSQTGGFYVSLTGTAASEVILDESSISNIVSVGGSTTFTITTKSTTAPGDYTLSLYMASNDLASPYTGTVGYSIAEPTPTATISASEVNLSLFPSPSTDGQINIKSDLIVDKIIVYGPTGSKEAFTDQTLFHTRQKGLLIVHVYTNKGIVVDKIFVQ